MPITRSSDWPVERSSIDATRLIRRTITSSSSAERSSLSPLFCFCCLPLVSWLIANFSLFLHAHSLSTRVKPSHVEHDRSTSIMRERCALSPTCAPTRPDSSAFSSCYGGTNDTGLPQTTSQDFAIESHVQEHVLVAILDIVLKGRYLVGYCLTQVPW